MSILSLYVTKSMIMLDSVLSIIFQLKKKTSGLNPICNNATNIYIYYIYSLAVSYMYVVPTR